MIFKILYFSLLIVLTKSVQPNCSPYNQFRSYCFPIEYCNEYVCKFNDCGYYLPNSEIITIRDTQIIPRCAFTNSPALKYIRGKASKIQVLASGSFVNLPNLDSILLPFNIIREVHQGVFKDVRVSTLDLSWNKITYISEGAFVGIRGLKYLNLSNNELKTFPVHRIPPYLVDLNLSHNLLDKIALNGGRCPKLSKLDFSHNSLRGVALFFKNALKKIVLSHNKLKNIDFYDVENCSEVEISSNHFSEVPDFLTYSKIDRVSIHSNPWNCDEFDKLGKILKSNSITVLIKKESNNGQGEPICTTLSGQLRITEDYSNTEQDCVDDVDCGENLVCRTLKCRNPCNENVCHVTNSCRVYNHIVVCLCPGNLKTDPRDIYFVCRDVECFVESDCKPLEYCSNNKTCEYMGNLVANYPVYITESSCLSCKMNNDPWWFYEIPTRYAAANQRRRIY